MIRFLNIKGQIIKELSSFAFYDTITDCILEFDGEQVFDNLEEFEDAYNRSYMNDGSGVRPLKRFTNLIPENYFNN